MDMAAAKEGPASILSVHYKASTGCNLWVLKDFQHLIAFETGFLVASGHVDLASSKMSVCRMN